MRNDNYTVKTSAQSYMSGTGSASHGSSCGAADPEKEQPSACGASCGTADPEPGKEQSSACGASCGAGEK